MAALFGLAAISDIGSRDATEVTVPYTHAAISSGDWAFIPIGLQSTSYDESHVVSAVFGGVTGTFVARVDCDTGAFGVLRFLLYQFAGAISANSSLVVDDGASGALNDTPQWQLCTVTGAHASTPAGTPVGAGDTDGSVGATVSVPSDGLIVSFALGVDVPLPSLTWANATERAEDGSGGTFGVATGTSGTPSFSFTPAMFGLAIIVAVPVSPAAVAAALFVGRDLTQSRFLNPRGLVIG